jgi:hypothetical protein
LLRSPLLAALDPMRLENCVDERRERGALREYEKSTNQNENYYNREEPELLSLSHEIPDLMG